MLCCAVPPFYSILIYSTKLAVMVRLGGKSCPTALAKHTCKLVTIWLLMPACLPAADADDVGTTMASTPRNRRDRDVWVVNLEATELLVNAREAAEMRQWGTAIQVPMLLS